MTKDEEFLLMNIKPKKLYKEIKKKDFGGIDINVYGAYFDITWEDSDFCLDYIAKLVDLIEYPEFHFPKCQVCKNKKKVYQFDEENLIRSLLEPFEYRFFKCSQCGQKYMAKFDIEYSKHIDRTMCFPAKDQNDALNYIDSYLNRPDDMFMSDCMNLKMILDAYDREHDTKSSETFDLPKYDIIFPKFRPLRLPKIFKPTFPKPLPNFKPPKPIKPLVIPKFLPAKLKPMKINIKMPKFKPIKMPKIKF